MKNDIQKPILYKADADLFARLENLKEHDLRIFNRNGLINDAVRLYLELIRLMQEPEYAYLNEVSFNDARLQRILFGKLQILSGKYPPHRYRK